MMNVTAVFKRLLASGKLQHGRHLFKWGNRWNIFGFNFTKRDALSRVYKISMVVALSEELFCSNFWYAYGNLTFNRIDFSLCNKEPIQVFEESKPNVGRIISTI
jgi:hypothetical protein